MCGATAGASLATLPASGLSPRVWGNLVMMSLSFSQSGPIPTCVGQPGAKRLEQHYQEAYPHVCGATFGMPFRRQGNAGLSPRVWGNLLLLVSLPAQMRPIPTCVGQPLSTPPTRLPMTAYPHVCGATVLSNQHLLKMDGLSPRVWGNLFAFSTAMNVPGPIPTCVGQPKVNKSEVYYGRAYPHVCGAT